MTETTPTLPVVPSAAAVHSRLRHLFTPERRIDDEAAGIILPIALAAGDPLAIDLDQVREYPIDGDGERGEEVRWVCHIYDLITGDRLLSSALPDGWMSEHLAHVPDDVFRTWQVARPNQWLVTDRYLLISGGDWWQLEDAPSGMLRYQSLSAAMRANESTFQEEQQRWATASAAAVEKLRPSWAADVEYLGDGDTCEGFVFQHQIGAVTIVQGYFLHPDGTVTAENAEPLIDVSEKLEGLSLSAATGVALALQTAIRHLEREATKNTPKSTHPTPPAA
ncbi:hypothetical protein RWH43_10640 [Microbacterium sp. KSW2-21]|uniref:DUF4132 domain-containing protein n=1 Tax=Microbacterium algihabitans TaxID=3075992 RepID=A0ABU3RWE2_9MICO|nr:hypothetical protein [Microbacterium sp. KSW2-21]MDU0327211.1 hypothetical protein [Microbacterium sp. KSW2-21]